MNSCIDFSAALAPSAPRLRHAFRAPRAVLLARDLAEVRPVLDAVFAAAQAGAWCVGYVRYEAARAFDAAFQVHPSQGPLAWFGLDDRLRDDAPALLAACKARGWRTLLLSGDSSPMVAEVAAQLGIDQAIGGLRPDDKLDRLKALQAAGRKVLMLGDGVNDVPVLAAADISIAMGSATDLAKTSADAVLLSNRLSSLVQALHMAQRTRRIIIENLTWASLYNGLVLPFAAMGWITPIWAALGMSLSSLLVVLNALRLTRP